MSYLEDLQKLSEGCLQEVFGPDDRHSEHMQRAVTIAFNLGVQAACERFGEYEGTDHGVEDHLHIPVEGIPTPRELRQQARMQEAPRTSKQAAGEAALLAALELERTKE